MYFHCIVAHEIIQIGFVHFREIVYFGLNAGFFFNKDLFENRANFYIQAVFEHKYIYIYVQRLLRFETNLHHASKYC